MAATQAPRCLARRPPSQWCGPGWRPVVGWRQGSGRPLAVPSASSCALRETKTIHDFQLMGPYGSYNWSTCWDDFQLRNKSTIWFPIVASFPSKSMLWGSICSLNFQFLIFPRWGKTRIQSTSRITKRTVVVWVSATDTEQTSTIETYMLILGGMLVPK